jgi:Nucleotidyl transferase AbiEii toxin, Type IV TA system
MDTFTPRLDVLPAAQRQLWPELEPIQQHGYVLYGGTAIALRLGHRQSVDFDFFSAQQVDAQRLRAVLSFVRSATVRQESTNTFEIETAAGVKVAFFGGLEFGRVGRPQRTADGVMCVASLDDLMATKVKVILQRSESKDYRDIAAMLRAGVRLEIGLAAAEKMFQPTFPPAESLKALVYFEGGDMARLSVEDRAVLIKAAGCVKSLPAVTISPSLAPHETVARASTVEPSVRLGIDPPRQGPRMGF